LGPKMAIVSTVLRRVALSQDFKPLFSWHTSSHDSVIAKFEEVWCIPKVFSTFGDLPPLSLDCGWPPGANGSLFSEWRCLQVFRVEDPLGARKGGPNRRKKWAELAGLGRPA
jgi:hypothetical protein